MIPFQWDILTLEVGLLCVIVAPWSNTTTESSQTDRKTPSEAEEKVLRTEEESVGVEGSPETDLVMSLPLWLMFRLMFLSGIVKLTRLAFERVHKTRPGKAHITFL